MKKVTLILLILCHLSFASSKPHNHLKSIKTISDSFAWAKNLESIEPSIWPYDILSIGHSMQSYQNYLSSPYWHDGLDIRGHANQKVFTTVSGKVVNIENYHPGRDLYWEVAILDDSGFVWKYHHVDKNSIPNAIKKAYRNGTRINQGDLIGEIVEWPEITYGEMYHHIHLLIVDGNGLYVNPFKLLPALNDTSLPVIKKIGLFDKRRKILNYNEVSGQHGVFIQAHDTVLHDQFKLTPYLITYKLDGGEEKTVWKFDYLPSATNDKDFINDFYLRGTCGDYVCRNFNININFDKTQKQATKFFNLITGEHTIEISLWDFAGNTTTQSFNYTVK